jgi:hypothetical protein
MKNIYWGAAIGMGIGLMIAGIILGLSTAHPKDSLDASDRARVLTLQEIVDAAWAENNMTSDTCPIVNRIGTANWIKVVEETTDKLSTNQLRGYTPEEWNSALMNKIRTECG